MCNSKKWIWSLFKSVSTPLQTWLTGSKPSLIGLNIYEYPNIIGEGVCPIYELGAQGINNQIWKDLGATVALKILQGTSLHLWAF